MFQFDDESDEEDGDNGMASQNDNDLPGDWLHEHGAKNLHKSWFVQPKYMPDWLYHFFGETVGPLIFVKNGQHLAKPWLFTESREYAPASFWIYPPEPVISLSSYHFDPLTLYHLQIFLWLPHCYVTELWCPNCTGLLEKNGTLAPHQIIEIVDNFYIVFTLQAQYLEALFELVHGHQVEANTLQTTMDQYFNDSIPSFGDFGDCQKYAGFVPSEHYLAKNDDKGH
ncbi:hypothetical protein L208DRAFT_1378541 [Tricholoma matsutake]|nr:hypothetical protein L208DRAFT_1378541 [Tricholoma matsutake 945]